MHRASGKQGRSNDIWLMSCQSLNIKSSFPIVNLCWIRAFEKINRVWRNVMYQGNAWDSLKLVLSSYTLVLFWWQLHASALIMVLFSNVRTWHLQKPALESCFAQVTHPRDFAGYPKSCLQGLLQDCCGAVAQAGVWLATCLRIIGDNNFPSLNSCFGLSTCSNSSLSSNIYPASPYKYFYPDSAFSWRQMLKSSLSAMLSKEQGCVELKQTMRGTLWLPACADYLE